MFEQSFVDPLVLNRFSRLGAVADMVLKGNFAGAQTQLDELTALPPVALRFDFVNAFNSSPVDFFIFVFEEYETAGKPPIRRK